VRVNRPRHQATPPRAEKKKTAEPKFRNVNEVDLSKMFFNEKRIEYTVRIVCGTISGAFVGLAFSVDVLGGGIEIMVAIVLCAIGFAAGAVKYGDKKAKNTILEGDQSSAKDVFDLQIESGRWFGEVDDRNVLSFSGRAGNADVPQTRSHQSGRCSLRSRAQLPAGFELANLRVAAENRPLSILFFHHEKRICFGAAGNRYAVPIPVIDNRGGRKQVPVVRNRDDAAG